MDTWVKKHWIMRWINRLFISLLLIASWGAQAAFMDSVLPTWKWCAYKHISPPLSNPCSFPTDFAALQAELDYINPKYAIANNTGYFSQNGIGTINSCDGNGQCHCTFVYPSFTTTGVLSVQNKPICPTPTTYSTIPYTYVPGYQCVRFIPSAITITLSGGNEIEPSKGATIKSLPITATVVDKTTNQPPSSPVKVHISLKVDAKSGGHDHGDSTRPRGGIEDKTCKSDVECWSGMTDGSGKVTFNFKAPEVSGTHTISASCDGCTNNPQSASVDVKVAGLETIPDSRFYALTETDSAHPGQINIIGSTAKHQENHYLAPAAAETLLHIAIMYQVEQQFKILDPKTKKWIFPPVLHLNDACLIWGGKFEIAGKWKGSHAEHRRGSTIDVRANALNTAIPEANFKKFAALARRYGVDPHFESPSIGSRHFHLRLLNRKE